MLTEPFYQSDVCYFADNGASLVILDQTLLPIEERYVHLHTAEEIADAIRKLRVRGAPLIGVAAAMGICVALKNAGSIASFESICSTIEQARPTAINLPWAVRHMRETRQKLCFDDFEFATSMLRGAAQKLLQHQKEADGYIGMYGAILLDELNVSRSHNRVSSFHSQEEEVLGILTHCNAGHLATGGIGTATAPIYTAMVKNIPIRVYVDETRPLLQGARLTAYELSRSGVPATLLCDNMAASLMAQGKIDIIFVGADRIARNGDTANKIGTSNVAILAKHFGIPFYVCAPQSTFDAQCAEGKDILIEQRGAEEVRSLWYRHLMAPMDVQVYNPSFDVTPHNLITAFVTEKGIMKPQEIATIFS